MKNRKKCVLAAAAFAVLLSAAALVAVLLRGYPFGEQNPNLARKRGVKATCDSVEREELSAAMAVDGDDENRASRWSSENNRENASHYIQLEFPEEISVSFVVLKWERRNVVSYALESSLDGSAWETLKSFETAPEALHQEIVLETPVQVKYLRLSTDAVSKEEADYSDIYQNVSLYEFEVYGDKPTAYKLKAPVIETNAEGERQLTMPEEPAGFRVRLIGADPEQAIGADGRVYRTIQDREVTVGYLVEDLKGREETREISFVVQVPAENSFGSNEISDTNDTVLHGQMAGEEVELAEAEEFTKNACPDWVIPSIAEWRGGRGVFQLREKSRIIVDTDSCPPEDSHEDASGVGTIAETDLETRVGSDIQALWDVAELMSDQCENERLSEKKMTVCKGTLEEAEPGDIYLGYAKETNGLGEEGYTCDITDKCVISAETAVGIRWGTVTLMQILSGKTPKSAPQGQIRDYPLYEVRGFGIDVARKAVSLDTLYAVMETMSWYKMNDLAIHLNDNTILATSGLTDTVEKAMTADSAFRLESSVTNGKGGTLTSEEYAYTQEEFHQLIQTAKTYGITVVPEIDTPAHSLSITKLYPAYALRSSNESVDQIDLGNEQAVALVERIWREALNEEAGAFREADIVNIGMDEYYGDGEQYRQYLTRINALVQETGKTVRLWGSLSNIDGTTCPSPENLQMNIWSTLWADPREMYEAGYSLINMQNNHLYIIPGGGYDYLDSRELYENWAPNKFYDYNQMETIPSYSPQMLGAAYMIWNDMSGRLDMGISEYDLYERFLEPLPALSMRLWGNSKLEETAERLRELQGPQPSAYELLQGYAADANKRQPRIFAGSNGRHNSCLYADTVALEPDYEIEMNVWLEAGKTAEDGNSGTGQEQNARAKAYGRQAQILAEGDCAYGTWAFYAVEPETGKVGFAREGRTYTFDYILPEGKWVKLKIVGKSGQTTLFVEGKEVDSLGSSEPFEEHATFVFPLQRVGGQTSHFDGKMELNY